MVGNWKQPVCLCWLEPTQRNPSITPVFVLRPVCTQWPHMQYEKQDANQHVNFHCCSCACSLQRSLFQSTLTDNVHFPVFFSCACVSVCLVCILSNRVLRVTNDDLLGLPHKDLTVCLLLVWIICYFCIWKGVKSTGKVREHPCNV